MEESGEESNSSKRRSLTATAQDSLRRLELLSLPLSALRDIESGLIGSSTIKGKYTVLWRPYCSKTNNWLPSHEQHDICGSL